MIMYGMSRSSTSVMYSSTRSVLGDNAESPHEYISHERSQSLRSGPHGLTVVHCRLNYITSSDVLLIFFKYWYQL